MKIQRTQQFSDDFRRLPQNIQSQANKKLALFFDNPFHPSHRIKKMKGFENIWEARITKNYRFTFHLDKDTWLLRRIGTHDILKTP
jgi:mRNA interferase RelE/StbE